MYVTTLVSLSVCWLPDDQNDSNKSVVTKDSYGNENNVAANTEHHSIAKNKSSQSNLDVITLEVQPKTAIEECKENMPSNTHPRNHVITLEVQPKTAIEECKENMPSNIPVRNITTDQYWKSTTVNLGSRISKEEKLIQKKSFEKKEVKRYKYNSSESSIPEYVMNIITVDDGSQDVANDDQINTKGRSWK